MFCGKCGKEMDNSARFCPYCGAENLEAKAAAPAGKPVSMPSLSLGGNANVPRIVLMVLSALQVLLFFTLSHGSVRLLSALNSIFGSEFSDKLTAMNTMRILNALSELGVQGADGAVVEFTILFLLPLVLGLAVLALNLRKGGGKTGLVCVVLSVLTLLAYILLRADLEANSGLGFTVESGMLAYVVTAAQIAAEGKKQSARSQALPPHPNGSTDKVR